MQYFSPEKFKGDIFTEFFWPAAFWMGTVLYSNAQLSASAAELFIVKGDGRIHMELSNRSIFHRHQWEGEAALNSTSLVLIY